MILKRAVFFLSLFLLMNAVQAYTIKGQIKNYQQQRWQPKVYLAAINSVNHFEMAWDQLIIREASLDEEGNFAFEGNNFPDKYQFYRLYLTEKPDVMSYLGARDRHNFIHLLINNKSNISVNVDLAKQPLFEAKIVGTPLSEEIAAFYRDIYYITWGEAATGTDASKQLLQNKAFEATKKAIEEVNSPYFTIIALAHLNWTEKREFDKDKSYYTTLIQQLETALPGNRYVAELKDQAELAAFRNSRFKSFLTEKVFFSLAGALGFLTIGFLALGQSYLKLKKERLASAQSVPLTKKEKEILELLLTEKSNKEIAAALFIETTTVKSHITNIFQKLNVTNRGDLLSKYKSAV